MKITAVCAMSSNYVIGDRGKIPFDIPEDRRFFREYCRYKLLVVGYKTFEGLPSMPDTDIFVLTNSKRSLGISDLPYSKAKNYHNLFLGDLDHLKALVSNRAYVIGSEIVIGGGGEVFRTFLPYLTDAHLTYVGKQVDGDVQFPISKFLELHAIRVSAEINYYECGDKRWERVHWRVKNTERKELVVN